METENIQSEQETPTPEVISTETPKPIEQSPSTDSDGKALYLQILRDKNTELASLRKQLAEKSKPVLPETTPEQDRDFFTNPAKTSRDIIREEVQTAVAPLIQFIGGMQQRTAYDQMKDRIRRENPVLAAALNENESFIDQTMQGVEVNENNLQAAIIQVAGAKAMGLIPNTPAPKQPVINNIPTPASTPTRSNVQNDIIPAHLRSTPPQRHSDKPEIVKPPLSPNEEHLRKLWGMSEDEFRAGQVEGAMILEPETKPKKKD